MRKRITSKKFTGLAAIVLIGSLGLNAAAAAPGAGERQFIVNAGSYDLRSAEGVAALYSTLRLAAESVCGLHDARGYAEKRHALRCADLTLGAVLADVGASELKAHHQAQSRRVRKWGHA